MNKQSELPIFYLCNDPLRGVGLEDVYPDYHIVCIDYTELVDLLIARGVKVFCFEKEVGQVNTMTRNTRKLIQHELVQDYILAHSQDRVGLMFFKPQFDVSWAMRGTHLEHERELRVLNSPTSVAARLENKVNFTRLCQEHRIRHTPVQIKQLASLKYSDLEVNARGEAVVQFERGWFGNRTFFIKSQAELDVLQDHYSDRQVCVSPYLDGFTLTNNSVVMEGGQTVVGYPFLQLSGVEFVEELQFARQRGSTVGNQWADLSEFGAVQPVKVLDQVFQQTVKVGEMIATLGFKGYFGLDFLVSERGEVYLQEINPRFTASSSMAAQLERKIIGNDLLSIHLRAFETDWTIGIDDYLVDDFFHPLKGMRVVVRNTQEEIITMPSSVKNGVYRLNTAEDFRYDKAGYRIDELDVNQMIVFTAQQDRQISVDQEFIQIQTLSLDDEKILKAAYQIKEEIIN